MYLVFFDESKPSKHHPSYHIGAVCIEEESLKEIEKEVSDLSKDVFGNSLLEQSTEFHTAELVWGKGKFKGMEFEDRLEVFKSLLLTLSRNDVFRFEIRINTEKLKRKDNPEEWAFMFLCERANDFIRARKSVGMLIGDLESYAISKKFSLSLSAYREKGTDYKFGKKITNLFESVHFTHSYLSRFLQLADLYTWVLQFKLKNDESRGSTQRKIFEVLKNENIDLKIDKYKIWP
jgi:hypothetical protein